MAERARARVVVCGAGALGSNALTLMRNFDADFAIVDFDRVESKNLLAQAFVKQSVGKNKAEALKSQLANFWSVKAESFPVRLATTNVEALCGNASLIVDCFDNAASRELLSGFARAKSIPLVHAAITADGTFGIVRWDERFAADAEDAPGQATCEGGEHLPFVVQVSAALARIVQDFLLGRGRRDVMVSLAAVTPAANG